MSNQHLINCVLFDLIRDYRWAVKNEDENYAELCKSQIGILFKNRHTAKLDPWGYPTCLRNK